MKHFLSIFSLVFLVTACSSSDDNFDNSSTDSEFIEKAIRVELTALIDDLEDFEDTEIELFFNGYNEPQVETSIPSDSTEILAPGLVITDKIFYYSFPKTKRSLSFSTIDPEIGGTFYIAANMRKELENDQDVYEVKIYHDDDLADTKIISAKKGEFFIADAFYLLEPTYINAID